MGDAIKISLSIFFHTHIQTNDTLFRKHNNNQINYQHQNHCEKYNANIQMLPKLIFVICRLAA